MDDLKDVTWAQIQREFTTPMTALEATLRQEFRQRVDFQMAPGGREGNGDVYGIVVPLSGIQLISLVEKFIAGVLKKKGDAKIFYCNDLPCVRADSGTDVIAYIVGGWA